MVAVDHQTGLLIAVPVYFLMLAGCAFWAHRRMEKMEHNQVSDKLTAHYLGGQEFGPLLTAGTVFASLFSGYTVIGVPNDAYENGWLGLRWMAAVWSITFGYFGTGIRLRKASNIRNHQSPVDFITDRFQSQFLRYTIVFLQVVPAVVYLSAQIVAIKGTFNSLFELPEDAVYPVIVIMAVILIFEWVGGLSSVALTDSIQAVVMFFSFIAVPSVLVRHFYGWKDLDPYTYPRPEFYQTPSVGTQGKFWQFSLLNVAFFTLPHMMQRTYAAKDLKSLKTGFTVMTVANWFTMPVGVFIGTVGVMILNGETVDSPFAAILEELMDVGGFSKFVAIIAATATLAAIMSTADSLVIAISQLITVEIAYPLRPQATPKSIAWIGKGVSFFAVLVSVLIGLFWKDGITDMGFLQFPISLQALPAFLFGLYGVSQKSDFHPWSIAVGAWIGTIYVFAIYFGYMKGAGGPVHIDAGMTSIVLQLVLTVAIELFRRICGISKGSYSEKEDEKSGNQPKLLFPFRPSWDVPKLKRFGESTLTPELLWQSMDDVNEPMASPSWAFLMFFSISILTPLTAGDQPPLDPATGNFSEDNPPTTVNGVPWWGMKILLLSIIPCVILLVSIWRMPDDFPVDEKKIEEEGVNPDLVELTTREKGRRTSYDERNVLIHRRRSTIAATMDDLGIKRQKQISDSAERITNRGRLSALVTANDKTSISFSVEEKTVEQSGGSPNAVDFSVEETGRRTSFGGRNSLVNRRRSTKTSLPLKDLADVAEEAGPEEGISRVV